MSDVRDLERDEFLGQAENLAQLMQHPAWPRYEELLHKMRIGALERLGSAKSMRTIARYQGAAAILEELVLRPHQIVAAAQTLVEDEKDRKNAARTALDLVERMSVEDDL